MVNMVIMCGKQIKNIRRKKEREFLDIKRKNIENTAKGIQKELRRTKLLIEPLKMEKLKSRHALNVVQRIGFTDIIQIIQNHTK
ncbi:MAG: hypothetical protein UW02_C0002G0021 [Candidatus Nomurabacteria bacterium GW2011_GWB1_43_7]|uniref:Uncharacterized protein n=3 Tax=Parcubacteria group TaxID=1794811 RepID=A0A0G1MAD3_9BACT|nr:MAG: hypothetical protein UW02_C0002G0021 [Candidatus Nomurabacteria bacterium GW2011_GWB1_43_7]KKU05037.1 MAG: hypothetical protein UX06_C0004G0005 [Candidatus Giovannonibacteria bacterium GW2011_GWA2_45_21]